MAAGKNAAADLEGYQVLCTAVMDVL